MKMIPVISYLMLANALQATDWNTIYDARQPTVRHTSALLAVAAALESRIKLPAGSSNVLTVGNLGSSHSTEQTWMKN